MGKRKRRAFTKEFKAETVRRVRDSGKSVGAVAREPDLTETPCGTRYDRPRLTPVVSPGHALTTEEREELGWLRRRNRTLRMERDILKTRSCTAPPCHLLNEKRRCASCAREPCPLV